MSLRVRYRPSSNHWRSNAGANGPFQIFFTLLSDCEDTSNMFSHMRVGQWITNSMVLALLGCVVPGTHQVSPRTEKIVGVVHIQG
jgi:pheromone shutdown protein TraB